MCCAVCFIRVEFMGMCGLFGAVLSGVQLLILERTELLHTNFTLVSNCAITKWQDATHVGGFSVTTATQCRGVARCTL
jgi:Solute carrier family 35